MTTHHESAIFENGLTGRDINNRDSDPSSEDPAFLEMLARVQAAPCYRGLDLRQQKDWAQAELEAVRFLESLRLERQRTVSEVNGSRV
jgi:hypothetical protein